MPNHISNRLTFESLPKDIDEWEATKQVKALMTTDDSPFDFNVLIPYPEDWAKADKVHQEAEEKALKDGTFVSFKDLPPDGYNHGGYEWCATNWGTKWNAYDITDEWGEIGFCTAWATPKPVWIELSKRFPDWHLRIEYADEDIGRNCGVLIYHNGKLIHDETESDLADPELFARATRYEQQYDYYFDEWSKARDEVRNLEGYVDYLKEQAAEFPGILSFEQWKADHDAKMKEQADKRRAERESRDAGEPQA